MAEVRVLAGQGETTPPRYLHWDGVGSTDGHVQLYAGSLFIGGALERKPFEFSQLLLMVKVTPLTGAGSGLSPSVAILCFPRGF